MPWFQVLIFVLKYGTSILSLVRGIWELVDWLREHDKAVPSLISNAARKRNLHDLARNAKRARDLSGLVAIRDQLAKRKAEIEGAA